MAGGAASELSRGGMRTKIEAAKIATAAGATMLIAHGGPKNPLRAVAAGAPLHLVSRRKSSPERARKTWIAGALEPKGALVVDSGAAKALRAGASLLPAGVKRIEGAFARGDAVAVRDEAGRELGRGLVA